MWWHCMPVRLIGVAASAAVGKASSACCAAVHDWLQKPSPGHTQPIIVRCNCIRCIPLLHSTWQVPAIVVQYQRHHVSNDSKGPSRIQA